MDQTSENRTNPQPAGLPFESRGDLALWHRTTRIPLTVFSGDAAPLRAAGSCDDLGLPSLLLQTLPQGKDTRDLPIAWQSIAADTLLFGGLALPDKRLLFLGPVLPFECGAQQAARILASFGMPQKEAGRLLLYFAESGPHTEDHIGAAISLLMRLLRLSDAVPEKIRSRIPALQSHGPVFPSDASGTVKRQRYEEELLSFIRFGKPEPLAEKLSAMPAVSGDVSREIPLYRPYIMMAITLASRAAVEAGVPYEQAMDVLNEYTEQLFDMRKNVRYIYAHSFLRFARMSEKVRSAPLDDPLAERIARHIRAHVHEKLTPSRIASALGYTDSYLCAVFRRAAGTTISRYVKRCKAEEAKRLLLLGHSCQETAEILSFPSQSSFTDAFRSVCGTAPSAWALSQKPERTGTR